jgi:hypothetical protein
LGEATPADLELARHEIERQTLELSGWSIWLETDHEAQAASDAA